MSEKQATVSVFNKRHFDVGRI